MLPSRVALIEFRRVEKAFGPKVVYRDLNLDVNHGELLTVCGGSGQGKSVMLKMLIGLLKVDAGTITFDGSPVVGLSEKALSKIRRRIGMLFQGAALFDSLSVRENVAYGLREHLHLAEKEIDARVHALAGNSLDHIAIRRCSSIARCHHRRQLGLEHTHFGDAVIDVG